MSALQHYDDQNSQEWVVQDGGVCLAFGYSRSFHCQNKLSVACVGYVWIIIINVWIIIISVQQISSKAAETQKVYR